MQFTEADYLRETAMTTYAVLKSVLDSTVRITDVLPRRDHIPEKQNSAPPSTSGYYYPENKEQFTCQTTSSRRGIRNFYVERNPRPSLRHKRMKASNFRYRR